MKQLNEYLVNKHITNNSVKLPKLAIKELNVPLIHDMDENNVTINTLKFSSPVKRFVLYNDLYHKRLHFASLSDAIGTMSINGDNFEDFGPEDIIMTADSMKELILNYLKKEGITLEEFAEMDGLENVYDNVDFLKGVAGVESDSQWGGENPFIGTTDDDCDAQIFGDKELTDSQKILKKVTDYYM